MTLGVLRAIRAAQFAVPDRLALVAVDDPPWAELVDPPLTVVAQPVQQIAETAMALLFERLTATGTSRSASCSRSSSASATRAASIAVDPEKGAADGKGSSNDRVGRS